MDKTQQPLPPIPPQPSHNYKILWILLGVFVLLTVAGLFVFKYQITEKSEVNTVQNVATTTDEFAGWKTYRNEEYGFEFKYPGSVSYKFEIVHSYNNQEQITGAFYKGGVYLFSFRMNGDFGYSEGCNEYGTKENIIINEIKMVKENNCGEIAYYFQPNNQHFFFGTAYGNDIKILDSILSTFKFTK